MNNSFSAFEDITIKKNTSTRNTLPTYTKQISRYVQGTSFICTTQQAKL